MNSRWDLTEKEILVVRLRLGIYPDEPVSLTLNEIGQRLRLSKERIRGIEAKAFHKLLHPALKEKKDLSFIREILETRIHLGNKPNLRNYLVCLKIKFS